jgi:hypothetical protein
MLAGAFDQIEQATVTRFDASGMGMAPVTFMHRIRNLRTPWGRVWNVEYDHRVDAHTIVKINHLRRAGFDELVVEPESSGASGTVWLESRGRSRYHETEFTVKHTGERDRQVTLSYVHARSEADLNAFDEFYGNYRHPLIRPNAYGPTSVDVPHRLLVQTVVPVKRWLVSGLFEARTGFPYSAVDDEQQFVGARNERRFPTLYTVDLSISREIRFRGRNVRIGLKVNHFLDNWAPRDVQTNMAAPDFGHFYNSIVPRFGVVLNLLP